MDGIQTRVQESVTKMVNELDKSHLRRMQADMYHCSAKCCETDYYTMEEMQRCVDKCSKPINSAQNYIQTELGSFQDRLQRCAMDCQDQVKDKITPSTSELDVSKYRGQFEGCVVKCADNHIALVPNMMSKMKEILQSHEQNKL